MNIAIICLTSSFYILLLFLGINHSIQTTQQGSFHQTAFSKVLKSRAKFTKENNSSNFSYQKEGRKLKMHLMP